MNMENVKLITANQSIEARDSLGLSQSAVSRDTGIPRVYVSQFESGKRILADEQLITLRDYYEELGWEAIEAEPDVAQPKQRIRDGLVIPLAIPEEEAERYLEAFHFHQEKASALLSEPVPRGLFGNIYEPEAKGKVIYALMHIGASMEALMKLQGNSDGVIAPTKNEEVKNNYQYMAKLIVERFAKDSEDERFGMFLNSSSPV